MSIRRLHSISFSWRAGGMSSKIFFEKTSRTIQFRWCLVLHSNYRPSCDQKVSKYMHDGLVFAWKDFCESWFFLWFCCSHCLFCGSWVEHTFRQELTIAYDVDNCRNFPQGEVSDMISDISTGIGYVIQNIESYGGDPNMWVGSRFAPYWCNLWCYFCFESVAFLMWNWF